MKRISISSNLLSLFTLHGVLVATALISFPLALKVLGAEVYASIVFAEAVTMFFLPVVIYGFDMQALRSIQALPEKTQQRAQMITDVFFNILVLRLCLLGITSLVVLLSIYLIKPESIFFGFAWLLLPTGWALQPTWYYQATQNHAPLAIYTVSTRIVMLGAMFTFLKSSDDALLFPILFGGATALTGALACLNVARQVSSQNMQYNITTRQKFLKDGFRMCASNMSVGLFRGSGIMFLTILNVSDLHVATYSMYEKIAKAIQASCRPLNQFFLPRIVATVVDHRIEKAHTWKRVILMTLPQVAFVGCLWLVVFTAWALFDLPDLIGISTDQDANVFTDLLMISIATVLGVFNFAIGVSALNALQYDSFVFLSVICAGIASVLISLLTIPFLGISGAILSFLAGEAVLFGLTMPKFYFASSLKEKGSDNA